MNKDFTRAFQKRNLGDYGYTSMLTKDEAIELTGGNIIHIFRNFTIYS